ncbi:tetratricopeptide repeat protein [Thermodesulfobacteriota bacterium]
MSPSPSKSIRTQHLITASILVFTILALYPLSLRLVSKIHYLKGVNLLRNGSHEASVNYFEKAVHKQPNDYMAWKGLGKAYQELGRSKSIQEAFDFAKKSEHAYIKAVRLNPLDAEAFFGLAEETAKLEQLHAFLSPADASDPYNALPYFEAAVRLKPNGISYHYDLARYLHRHNKKKELEQAVSNLTRIYPSSYHYLKGEMFWSPEVSKAAEQGMRRALEAGTSPRSTNMIFSLLLEERKDWSNAIVHYQKALSLQSSDNTSANYYHLGRLYLENRQFENAEDSFISGLSMSAHQENDLENIYRAYKAKGHLEALYRLYLRAERDFDLSSRIHIFLARSQMDRKQYHQAKQILINLSEKDETAEAFYWLYRIAEIEKDLDSMELAIQKATVLDPNNSQYHLIFSQILLRLNKLERAEKAAGLALKHSVKPSAHLYNHRAWIRWKRNNFAGAAADWEEAARLNPTSAAYHAQAAEAYLKEGKQLEAMDHFQKAVNLDPKNLNYKKRYDELLATQE